MANLLIFVNNASSALLGNVGPTDVSIALVNGDGAKFPSPAAGTAFLLTIEDSSGNLEIVECTARAGDILTVVRGREGTAARAFTAGDTLEARVTAGMLAYLDWQTPKNAANGPVVLDIDGNVPQAPLTVPVQAIGDARYQPALGFTPVEQGGGAGMGTNKVRFGWDGTFALMQIDSTGYQLPIRTSAGTVLQLTNNARCKVQSLTNEDDLFLGPNGWYAYSNATDAFGLYHATKGSAFAISDADKSVNFTGTIKQGGVAVTLTGHTHTIANIAGLQGALDAKFNAAGGTVGNTTVDGTLTATVKVTAPSIVDTSDQRYKTNIVDMSVEDAIAIVRGTRARRFFNKQTNANDFGVVAQEQLAATPEIVPMDSSGMYGVQYQRLVAPLAVAVQNLLTRVELLEVKP